MFAGLDFDRSCHPRPFLEQKFPPSPLLTVSFTVGHEQRQPLRTEFLTFTAEQSVALISHSWDRIARFPGWDSVAQS